MKATTSLFIDRYHPKADGKCGISIRVTFDRKKKYYTTGKTATIPDFEKSQGEKPRNEFKDLALKLYHFEKKAVDIIERMPAFSFKSFEKLYQTNSGNKHLINSAFIEYSNKLREGERIGTASSYECARNSLKNFAEELKFTDITPDLLCKYENGCLKKIKA